MTRRPQGSECECTACGRFFSSLQAFDLHQQGATEGYLCRDPATSTRPDGETPLFRVVSTPRGSSWGVWLSPEKIKQLKGLRRAAYGEG